MAESIQAQVATIQNDIAALKEQVRKLSNELMETRAFFRSVTAELRQQINDAKAAVTVHSSGSPVPPRLLPQR